MPMVPFVIAAGAAQYSRNKFIAALTIGRAIRFTVLAFLAARYGGEMVTLLARHSHAFLWIGLGLIAAIGLVSVFVQLRGRRVARRRKSAQASENYQVGSHL
jgi:membrane protein DedA with SNARE-associated domain